jgi:putative ABC transport system permease protein
LTRPDGGSSTLTIGAITADDYWFNLFSVEVIMDPAAYVEETGDPSVDRVFVTLPDGASSVALDSAVGEMSAQIPGADVRTAERWLDQRADDDRRGSQAIMIALFGGAALFTLFGSVMAVLSTARERRGEFALLRTTGASPQQVVAAVAVETLVVMATAAALLAVVLGFGYVRVGQALPLAGAGTIFPLGVFVTAFAVCAAAALIAAVVGTAWALRGSRLDSVNAAA